MLAPVAVSLGTLVAGESVTVDFDAVVNNPLPKGLYHISNQATLAGTGFNFASNPAEVAVDQPPQVTDVFVRGADTPSLAGWEHAFLDYLATSGRGDATYGFRITGGADELKTLPWANLNQLSLRFSENVDVHFDDLQLLGSNTPAYHLDSAAFSYDDTTFTATWRLDAAINPVIGAEKIRVVLGGGPGGVTDASGSQLLDGEWLDGTALYPSGDGVAGGDFSFRINAMPGDTNRDSGVTVTDMGPLRASLGRIAGDPLYDPFADLDGNGGVTILDVGPLRNNLGRVIPAAQPAGTPGIGWVPEILPDPPLGPGTPPEGLSVTKTGSVLVDNDGDGQADPGDTLRWTVTVINSSTRTIAELDVDDQLNPQLALVDNSTRTTRYLPPDFQVITHPGFREGDTFEAVVTNAAPNAPVDVRVIGDENTTEAVFDAYMLTTDANGGGRFSLTFPYVLAAGFHQDCRTVRVSVGGVTEDFSVLVLEGIRVSVVTPDTNGNIREGASFTVNLRNGIGESRVIVQIIGDNDTVEHEYGFRQTDGSDSFNGTFEIPDRLIGLDHREDGRTVRVLHGNFVGDFKITVHEGLRITVGHKKTREGHTFPVEVRNGAGKSEIAMSWWLDGKFVDYQPGFYETDENGYADLTITTPDLTFADSDFFTFQVATAGQMWEFGMTVFNASDEGPPDPGGPAPIVNQTGSPANKNNTVPANSFARIARDYVNGTPISVLKGRVAGAVAENQNFWDALVKYGRFGVDRLLTAANALTEQVRAELTDVVARALTRIFDHSLPDSDYTPRNLRERAGETLVVLGLGRGQEVADGSPFNLLYNRLSSKLPHVNIWESCDCGPPDEPLIRCWDAEAILERWQRTRAMIESVGAYIESLNIKSVVLAGFSYGGGLVFELGTWLAANRPSVKIIGAAYVDAIDLLPGLGGAEISLPPGALSALNIYQSKGIVDLHGSSVATWLRPTSWPNTSPGEIIQWDADTLVETRTHDLMDDTYWDEVEEYVYRIIDRNYPQ